MRRLVMVAMIPVAIAGCASQQAQEVASAPRADSTAASRHHYASAEDWYWAIMSPEPAQRLNSIGVPSNLQHDSIECFWRTYWGHLNANEQAVLDSYAKGITDLSPSSSPGKELLGKVDEVNFKAMEPYCPQTMSALMPYFQRAGQKGLKAFP